MPNTTSRAIILALGTFTFMSSQLSVAEEQIAQAAAVESPAQTAEAAAPAPRVDRWSLLLPKDANVIYRGQYNYDAVGLGQGNMVYPAFGLAGLVAGMITHGLLVEGQKSRQRTKIEEEADKVLTPYRAIIDAYTYKELMQTGLEKTSAAGSKKIVEVIDTADKGWVVESVPIFYMTQDQQSLILSNSISIRRSDAEADANSAITVQVVSRAQKATDMAAYWTENEGHRIKGESVNLLADSLTIALGQMNNPIPTQSLPFKTFRFKEGSIERMERAQLIKEGCGKRILRTLRGGFIVVPLEPGEGAANSGEQCSA